MKTVIIDTAREGQVLLRERGGADQHTLGCEGGRGKKLKAAFAHAFGEMGADAVITLPASGECTAEALQKIENALEAGASVAVYDRDEPSPLLFGGAFSLLTRLTAGLKVAPWASLRGYRRECAELLASVGGAGADYECALLQAAVTEKLPLAQITAEKEEKSTEKCQKSLVTTFFAALGIFNQSQSLKFLFSSGVAFVIDTLLLTLIAPLLRWNAGVNEAVAQTAAWIVSSLTNFTINQKFVFRAKGGALLAFGQYYSLAIFVLLAKQALLFLFSTVLALPLLPAKVICEVTFFVLNYFVQKKLIFNRKKAKEGQTNQSGRPEERL